MNLFTKALDYMYPGLIRSDTTDIPKNPNIKVPRQKQTKAPAGRTSYSEYENENLKTKWLDGFCRADFEIDIIPVLRKLYKHNDDVGSVVNDLIQLTNTGHNIIIDQSIDSALADKIKTHLEINSKKWGSGVAGIEGLVNKWVAQIWISGALSNEWVPAKDLSGVTNSVLVNPENIRFKYNTATTRYEPYQIVRNRIFKDGRNAIPLNPNTYFYVGILGDSDLPYGVPPFLTAIEALRTQKTMRKNINHILSQLGLLGYLQVSIDKPDQLANESVKAWEARQDALLLESKRNVIGGFSEGVVVGFKEDVDFDFHSTTKNLSGVTDIYNQNETSVANGLKTSPSFIGQKGSGTENNMSIVFTKMLSQLKNIQSIISACLLKGYILELQLAGFNIKTSDIKITWNASTISDDLKSWQAKEIKQRVTKSLLIDGVISNDTYAEENGYKKPALDKPLIPYDEQVNGKTEKDPEQKEARKEVKKKSDRKVRDKNKKQPKRKDTNTKPQ